MTSALDEKMIFHNSLSLCLTHVLEYFFHGFIIQILLLLYFSSHQALQDFGPDFTFSKNEKLVSSLSQTGFTGMIAFDICANTTL